MKSGFGLCGIPEALIAQVLVAMARHPDFSAFYEALPVAGGMMKVGIPDYRLPKDKLEAEISVIERAGVEIRLGSPVASIEALMDQGFKAVFVGTGVNDPRVRACTASFGPSLTPGNFTFTWAAISFCGSRPFPSSTFLISIKF